MTDYVILYAFHQTNASKIILDYFIENALSDKATYFFLLNKPYTVLDRLSKKYPNVHLKYYEWANTAWQKWASILDEIQGKYTYYFFIKDKMMGPFLTEEMKDKKKSWMSIFVEPLDKSNLIISPIINPLVKHQKGTCRPHLQVNFLAVHNTGILSLLSHNFFRY